MLPAPHNETPPRALTTAQVKAPIAFTIATLVTDPAQYAAMRQTFSAAGFTGDDCEYLLIDNTGPAQTDAYRGLNAALAAARGRYVILCHQDVRLIPGGDDRTALEARLADLETRDPAWALAGNAGGTGTGRLALRLTDPHGTDRKIGDLPARVVSLDENFIVVKRAANLGFSRNLGGFHFYGADIAMVADILGWRAYVIDFHLRHLSPGNADQSFAAARTAFREKWRRALRPRWLQTTCSLLRIGGGYGTGLIAPYAERPLEKLARRWRSPNTWIARIPRPDGRATGSQPR